MQLCGLAEKSDNRFLHVYYVAKAEKGLNLRPESRTDLNPLDLLAPGLFNPF